LLAHAEAVPAADGTTIEGQLGTTPVQASPLPKPADLLPIFKQQVAEGLQKQYNMDPADAAAVADNVTMGQGVFPFDGAQLAALATCSSPVSAASVARVLDIGVLDTICTSAFASKGSNFASAVMQRAGSKAAYARQCRLRDARDGSPEGSPRIVEIPHGPDGAEAVQPTTMLVDEQWGQQEGAAEAEPPQEDEPVFELDFGSEELVPLGDAGWPAERGSPRLERQQEQEQEQQQQQQRQEEEASQAK